MYGTKHIIECRCILPTLKNRKDPPLHRFVVFSVIKNDEVIEKFTQCNNCDIVHRVYDLCKSEIMHGREDLKSSLTIDDIKFSLPSQVVDILENYHCDLATYEHVKFMYESKAKNEFTVLVKEKNDSRVEGKILRYKDGERFFIEPFSSKEIIK